MSTPNKSCLQLAKQFLYFISLVDLRAVASLIMVEMFPKAQGNVHINNCILMSFFSPSLYFYGSHHMTTSPECQPSGLSSWPQVFVVPKFTYEAEFVLQQKNNELETNGTYFSPGPKLKGVILDGLAQEMMKYTKYRKDYQHEEVAADLTRTHPSLGQLGSKTGFWGWKQSLKYKMQNYWTKLGSRSSQNPC